MAERSIIFFDIDGTLLNREKKLPSSAKEAVFQLKKQGHVVAIATGRAPFMFEPLRQELEIDTFVSYNGQYVVLEGQTIFANPLNPEALRQLTDTALLNGHPVVFMDHDDLKANVPEHDYIHESISELKIDRMPSYDPNYPIGRNLYQSLLFCTEGEEQQYIAAFTDFDFIRWHPLSVDILPKGGSKAKGIAKIVERLGIPPERQYAFGDGLNDIEMLSAVQNSVAMGNAEEQVKRAARYVTKAAEEDGVYCGLRMLGLL
jgi:hypothetical protein